jgi:hypothetical protein
MTYPKLFLLIAVLIFAISVKNSVWAEQASEPRQTYITNFFQYTDERPDVPVLYYTQRRGHHGQRIADSEIDKVFIWKDGTIDWSTRLGFQWHRATIPAEKVDAALQEIAESFAKYPVKDRIRGSFSTLRLGANYSPRIKVFDSRHYQSVGMDDQLWTFYLANRDVLQSDDNEAILRIVKGEFRPRVINPADGLYLSPSYSFDYRGVVEHYRSRFTGIGLSEPGTRTYADEEILKCALLFVANAEHLLVMEKKIMELLALTEGLEVEKLDIRPGGVDILNVHVEREVKDGKSEFFYSRISREEHNRIMRSQIEEMGLPERNKRF